MKKNYIYIILAFVFLFYSSFAVAAEKVIKIAYYGPMTGDYAVYGKDMTTGMEVAIKEINDAGGIKKGPLEGYKFKMVGYDDKADVRESVNIAQKLCAEEKDLLAVFNGGSSSSTLAVLPVYERCGMPVIVPYSTNRRITKSGYSNVVRVVQDDIGQGQDIAWVICEKLKKKERIAVFYENSDYGVGLRDVFTPEVKKYGGNIVAVESYISAQDKDFSVILTKIKALNPDALVLLSGYNEGGLITRQARAMGIQAPIVSTTSLNTPTFIELAGQEAAEGVILAIFFNPESKDPKVVKFNDAYRKMFNRGAGESSGLAYDSVYLLKDAIERGGTTRETVMKYLRATKDFIGVTGKMNFDEGGQVVGKIPGLLVVKSGKFVPMEW